MTDETPIPLGDPIEPLTDDEIVRYARGLVTNEFMLADVNDRDWSQSLMLMLCSWTPVPSNCSTIFLVPLAPHQGGRWLNGRVPGVTISAVPVAVESVEPLHAKALEFWALLNPEVAE